jgi:hypothetical protein
MFSFEKIGHFVNNTPDNGLFCTDFPLGLLRFTSVFAPFHLRTTAREKSLRRYSYDILSNMTKYRNGKEGKRIRKKNRIGMGRMIGLQDKGI